MKHQSFFLKILLVAVGTCVCLSGWSQPPLRSTTQLHEGDLIFHVAPQENAITQSTGHMGDYRLDHVAIFFRHNGQPSVVEATEKGVVVTPIDSFVKSGEQYLIGRLTQKFKRRATISNALQYLGRAYDFYFLPDNEAIYCSELVLLSFVDKHGQFIFQPIPMSFHDASGQILPYWLDHYAQAGLKVPEGAPGSNPTELAKRKNIRLFKLNIER